MDGSSETHQYDEHPGSVGAFAATWHNPPFAHKLCYSSPRGCCTFVVGRWSVVNQDAALSTVAWHPFYNTSPFTIQILRNRRTPTAVTAADRAYQNAMQQSDRQNAHIEHDRALQGAIIDQVSDHTELLKLFMDNPCFKKWLGDIIFNAMYQR